MRCEICDAMLIDDNSKCWSCGYKRYNRLKKVEEQPTGFNDCRCEKCDAKVGWFGSLSEPPRCKCGHLSDYSDVEKQLDAARAKLIAEIEAEGTE